MCVGQKVLNSIHTFVMNIRKGPRVCWPSIRPIPVRICEAIYQCEYYKFFSQLQPPLFAPCRHERPCRETPPATGWRLTSGLFAGSTTNPRGYPWEFLVGLCRPVLQILALFTAKKCHLQHPFSDQTSKIHTRFQTWPLGGNCYHYLD